VRADAKQFGNSLESTRGFHHHPAGAVVAQTLAQVIEQVRRSFNANQVDDLKAASGDLRSQLTRPVQIPAKGPRVKGRQAASPLDGLHFGLRSREPLVDAQPKDGVHSRRPARNRGREYRTASADYPLRLRQSPHSVPASVQVIQRTEQQHRVDALVRQV
jgi:hypothetical protein